MVGKKVSDFTGAEEYDFDKMVTAIKHLFQESSYETMFSTVQIILQDTNLVVDDSSNKGQIKNIIVGDLHLYDEAWEQAKRNSLLHSNVVVSS